MFRQAGWKIGLYVWIGLGNSSKWLVVIQLYKSKYIGSLSIRPSPDSLNRLICAVDFVYHYLYVRGFRIFDSLNGYFSGTAWQAGEHEQITGGAGW